MAVVMKLSEYICTGIAFVLLNSLGGSTMQWARARWIGPVCALGTVE